MTITRKRIDEIDATYWRDHQVDGITFVRWRHEIGYYGYDTGADNALFTGYALAAFAFRYGVTGAPADLGKVRRCLDGIHLLTNVTGTPGALVRLAFPLEDAWIRIGYSRTDTDTGNTWTARRLLGQMGESDTHFWYANTTRDQLIGIVYGLSVARAVLRRQIAYRGTHDALFEVSKISDALTTHLESTNWSLRDFPGGKITARKPLHALRYALRLLQYRFNRTETSPSTWLLRQFFRFNRLATFYYWLPTKTFVWNLRIATAFAIWITASDDTIKEGAAKWLARCWRSSREMNNPFFAFSQHVVNGSEISMTADTLIEHVASATVGHDGFFAWQKPRSEQTPAGDHVGPGIDVLLPYWMRRYYE